MISKWRYFGPTGSKADIYRKIRCEDCHGTGLKQYSTSFVSPKIEGQFIEHCDVCDGKGTPPIPPVELGPLIWDINNDA